MGGSISCTALGNPYVPGPPTCLKALGVTNISATLQWFAPSNPNGAIVSYSVYCMSSSQPHCLKEKMTSKINSIVIIKLFPYSYYSFCVSAQTTVGEGTCSKEIRVKTAIGVPDSPMNLQTQNVSNTSVALKWSQPEYPNGEITNYCVHWKSGTVLPSSTMIEGSTTTVWIGSLFPYRNYTFCVSAFTIAGEGPCSNNLVVETHTGIPPFPDNRSSLIIKSIGKEEAAITWSNDTFSAEMGTILYYSVIVAYDQNIGVAENGVNSEAKELPSWSEFQKHASNIYQATYNYWNPFTENGYDPLHCSLIINSEKGMVQCVIGWEKNCSQDLQSYCNGPLMPGKQYGIKIRGFTKAGYSETNPMFIATGTDSRKISISLIGGCMAPFIVFFAFGIMLYTSKRNNHWMYNYIVRIMSCEQSLSPQDGNAYPCSTITLPEKHIKSCPLNFENFLLHVQSMMLDSHLKFSLEFEEIKQSSPKHLCTAAEMEENRSKNRWMNIFPFDHSRVKLLPIDDEPGSDYINANYIPGLTSHREYIASQGPLPGTVDDFWRMIWEQEITMIVMLTQCVERGKAKCQQYWPTDSENVYYGDLKLQLKSESILSTYSIRIFDVQLGNRQRTVKQMHFTRWPDFGCPESPEELINFVRAVQDHLPHMNTGPIVVHCSAGVGRTGTFIAMHRLMHHIQSHITIDVYGTVMDMREYRTNMVQTEDQYIYIHKCMKDLVLERLNTKSNFSEEDDCDSDLYSNIMVQRDTKI